MAGIPVVYIRGLLESGKTTFLQDAIIKGDFGDVGKSLILALEQGEIEYDIELLKKYKSNVVYIESKEDFNKENIANIIRENKPDVIFLESNEMWNMESIEFPSYFDFQQVMCMIDGTTFATYLNNMRQKFVDMIKGSDIVLINRCKPTSETSSFKRNVKMINSNCTPIAIDENGNVLNLESDLPFDLKGEIIKLELSQFGAWYIDTFDQKERYNNRVIEFDCMAVFDKKLPPKSFIAGRLAMTCCVDDIQLIGHLCAYTGSVKLKNQSWIHLKARIHYLNFRGSSEEQVVLELISLNEIAEPKKEEILVTLN